MKNNVSENITREAAQHELDQILQQQTDGFPVTLSQIKQADDNFTRIARAENIADLQRRLYAVGAEFETLSAQRAKARDAIRAALHKKDELTAVIKKIETYLEGVNLKLNIAAVEESEVLEMLEQA
jgi:uncharacterized protein YdcH (DUF465 family)